MWAALFVSAGLVVQSNLFAASSGAASNIEGYSNLVYASYKDAYEGGLKLQTAVQAFISNPSDATLAQAKEAWFTARVPYLQTEAYRFYGGPIDGIDKDGKEGPEGQLNAWPLNEAHMDYVAGNPSSGIINDASIAIDESSLIAQNAKDDEKNVSTGYHAIEFLLWGQDFNANGPGNRSFNDYLKGDPIKDRRRAYLGVVTDLLVKDLKFLADAWKPGQENYAAEIKKSDAKEALGKILTGLATLSGFELASERLGTPLDSGDQEDEHSCFSDNTHNDYIYDVQGINNVYFGEYGSAKWEGLNKWVASFDPELNKKIEAQVKKSLNDAKALDHPIDQVLATPRGSPQRAKMEELLKSLEVLADLFKQIGKEQGLNVEIVRS